MLPVWFATGVQTLILSDWLAGKQIESAYIEKIDRPV
jgi:hypothetical protein